MAGLGLAGHMLAGGAKGFFDSALKGAEQKRKEGFERLKQQMAMEVNTQNNQQRHDSALAEQQVKNADDLARLEQQNAGLMARQTASDKAMMDRVVAQGNQPTAFQRNVKELMDMGIPQDEAINIAGNRSKSAGFNIQRAYADFIKANPDSGISFREYAAQFDPNAPVAMPDSFIDEQVRTLRKLPPEAQGKMLAQIGAAIGKENAVIIKSALEQSYNQSPPQRVFGDPQAKALGTSFDFLSGGLMGN